MWGVTVQGGFGGSLFQDSRVECLESKVSGLGL